MSAAGFSIVSLQRRGDTVRAEIAVDADGRWFDGHFPGDPVLPAVAHFDLLRRVHRDAGGTGEIAALDRVRLTAPVRPGDRLELSLDPAPAGQWRFTLRLCDGETVSDGRVRWAAPEAGV